MTLFILVGVLMLAALGGIFFVLYSTTGAAISQYNQDVRHAADNSLAEMFIFIDDRRLKLYSGFAFVVITIVLYALTQSLLASFMMGAVVFLMPNVVIALMRKYRLKRFNQDLPDSLLSMSTMLRSGLNLNSALGMVVAESKGPIAQEFGLLLNELKMGREFEKALDDMYQRVPIPDLELVVAGMKISREVGGSLADVLSRLAETIRRRIEMDGKIRSLTSMGVLQGWVMTLLPLAVGYALYVIEPETMMKLFYDWRGWIACTLVVLLEFMGYKTIRKIVNIDV